MGSRSPNRDIDYRDASHGLITGPASTISPVRTATREYISQLKHDNDSL